MAFATRRRFGLLGLALCAGYLLSEIYTNTLTPFIEQQGVSISYPPLEIVVQTVLILLPAAVLLLSGASYQVMWQRVLGAVAFSTMAMAFLMEPLTSTLQFDAAGTSFVTAFGGSTDIIIGVGVILAVADALLTGYSKPKKHSH